MGSFQPGKARLKANKLRGCPCSVASEQEDDDGQTDTLVSAVLDDAGALVHMRALYALERSQQASSLKLLLPTVNVDLEFATQPVFEAQKMRSESSLSAALAGVMNRAGCEAAILLALSLHPAAALNPGDIICQSPSKRH